MEYACAEATDTAENAEEHNMIKQSLKLKTAEIRSARATIERLTGIVVQERHRCSWNCEAYVSDNQQHCGICEEERFKVCMGVETLSAGLYVY